MKNLNIIFFFLFFTFPFVNCAAQFSQNNDLSVIQHKSIDLSYFNIDDLLKNKIITDAIEVDVKFSQPKMEIFASIVYGNFKSSSSQNKVGLKLSSQSLSQGYGNDNEFILTSFPIKVLTIAAGPNINFTALFFDIIQHASKEFLEVESDNFSIVFSTSKL